MLTSLAKSSQVSPTQASALSALQWLNQRSASHAAPSVARQNIEYSSASSRPSASPSNVSNSSLIAACVSSLISARRDSA